MRGKRLRRFARGVIQTRRGGRGQCRRVTKTLARGYDRKAERAVCGNEGSFRVTGARSFFRRCRLPAFDASRSTLSCQRRQLLFWLALFRRLGGTFFSWEDAK